MYPPPSLLLRVPSVDDAPTSKRESHTVWQDTVFPALHALLSQPQGGAVRVRVLVPHPHLAPAGAVVAAACLLHTRVALDGGTSGGKEGVRRALGSAMDSLGVPVVSRVLLQELTAWTYRKGGG